MFEEKGTQDIVNIHPVIPFHLNDDWNLITRTILPITLYQPDLALTRCHEAARSRRKRLRVSPNSGRYYTASLSATVLLQRQRQAVQVLGDDPDQTVPRSIDIGNEKKRDGVDQGQSEG